MGKIRALGKIRGSIVHRNFPIAGFFPIILAVRDTMVHWRLMRNKHIRR